MQRLLQLQLQLGLELRLQFRHVAEFDFHEVPRAARSDAAAGRLGRRRFRRRRR
jgi:hypothetical protein